MDLTPNSLSTAERYKLLIGCIVPRPIALVSTLSPQGRPNLAPFSFFSGVGSNPMTVIFCPGTAPDGSDNDTMRNALPLDQGGTGEFVINAAVEPYIREVSASAEPLPYGQSEFDLIGLDTHPSTVVAPPRVAASPYAFECRTLQIVRTNPGAPSSGNIVVGEVVHIYIRDDLINDRMHVDPDKLAAVGRMGGMYYCTTRDRFSLPRGTAALEQNESPQ